MREALTELLILCYGATAIVNIIAYWPTIQDLYINKKPSANVASYLLWSITTGIAFLYSLFIVTDTLLRVVSGAFFFSNLLILFLSLRLSRNH